MSQSRPKAAAAEEAEDLRTLSLLSEVAAHANATLPESIRFAVHDLREPRGGPMRPHEVSRSADVERAAVPDDFHEHPDAEAPRHTIRTSSLVIRDGDRPVAALCINVDVTDFMTLRHVADRFLGEELAQRDLPSRRPGMEGVTPSHTLVGEKAQAVVDNVDEFATILVHESIARVGIPVDLMRKEHKLKVVAELQKRGLFALPDAVDTVAGSLGVSRFTIYNYLKELDDEESSGQSRGSNPKKRASGAHRSQENDDS